MNWLKLDSKGILRGSLSRSDNVTQLIWIKMLAMANETRDRDGYLRFKPGKPYTLEYIATVCDVTKNQIEIALDDFMEDIRDDIPRVEFTEDGSIRLNNWKKYQSQPFNDESTPRMKSAIEREAIQRRMDNQHPDVSRSVLAQDFHDTVVSQHGEVLASPDHNNGFHKIFKCYESNIGLLVPLAAEKLKELLSRYPHDWVERAIDTAVKNNAKKLNYIEACLENWERDGFDKRGGNGHKTDTSIPGNKPAGAFAHLAGQADVSEVQN